MPAVGDGAADVHTITAPWQGHGLELWRARGDGAAPLTAGRSMAFAYAGGGAGSDLSSGSSSAGSADEEVYSDSTSDSGDTRLGSELGWGIPSSLGSTDGYSDDASTDLEHRTDVDLDLEQPLGSMGDYDNPAALGGAGMSLSAWCAAYLRSCSAPDFPQKFPLVLLHRQLARLIGPTCCCCPPHSF
eukprot:SAG22_NODE_2260_length_2776_cov_2.762047_3_plen_187_part_00